MADAWVAEESISTARFGDTEGTAQGKLVREVGRLYARLETLRTRFYGAEPPASPVENQISVFPWNSIPVAWRWDASSGAWREVGGTLPGQSIPIGGIILWYGAATAVPAHYALCDGGTYSGQKTPDLRDKFVLCAGGSYAQGATGGEAAVSLLLSQLPGHTHVVYDEYPNFATPATERDDNYTTEGTDYLGTTRATTATGGGSAHENRPPYRALCYIMRVT